MSEEIILFFNRFNQNKSIQRESEFEIKSFEDEFKIELPQEFKEILLNYGDLWTPSIMDLIVENDLDLHGVQDFWKIEQIKYDKQNEWASQLETDLIPFASDCMGNIFGFKTEELMISKGIAKIYFFDHDFDTIDPVADSFLEWIKEYLKIKG